ncbi:MAG: hypothetical protein C4583_17100 [Anaerolineaceae bacterium]|nr:MAG: hypothetical protein C4583_17100 [Anaerolineaceae bacterium]
MNKRQINADRRRKGEGPVGRADAPRRDTGGGSSGGFQPSGGMPRPVSSGGGFSSRGKQMGGCGTVIVVVLLIAYFMLSNGGGLDLGGLTNTGGVPQDDTGFQNVQPELPQSNFTPPAPSTSGGQTWTIMLYQDADDQVLERDIYLDLNEAERVGSSQNVNIVAQVDRFRAGFDGDGNWTSARRYYVTQDSDLNVVHSQVAQELGEVDMSDGQTLVEFVQWAAQNFPADKYVLILSDHGMGWPGGWSDPAPGNSGDSSTPLSSRLGNNIFLSELDQALGQARSAAGINRFEIIGMDACLMAQIEVMAALQPHANYAVASEEVEPSIGWAYASFLGDLVQNPDMSGAQLSKAIVDGYIVDDQRILDPAARAEFMRGGSPLGSFFGGGSLASADQLAAQLSRDVTLTAINLNAFTNLMTSYNDFVYQLRNEDQQLVAQARTYSQSYTSIFGREVPPSYIDLGHFVLLIQNNTRNSKTSQAADVVIVALKNAIIAEKHGSARKGSTGLAIYFPNSTLYRSPVTGPQSYVGIASRFASGSLWDDFLAYHYLDREFTPSDATPYVPSSGYSTRAPGQGDITISNMRTSTNSVTTDQSVDLSVDISGTNIGYIYLFVGYFDANANSLNVTDTDYLESPDRREVSGVYYPVWDENGFTLNFTWEPIVFGISDGTQNAVALFKPDFYGADAASASYTVEGLYTFVQTGQSQYAQLRFQDGKLVAVYGFNGQDDTGAPREITPTRGDTFTIYETWMDVDANGQVTGTVKEQSRTLTFGDQPFKWVELYAAAGDYVVGFIVEDLDGNQYPIYTQITVQ